MYFIEIAPKKARLHSDHLSRGTVTDRKQGLSCHSLAVSHTAERAVFMCPVHKGNNILAFFWHLCADIFAEDEKLIYPPPPPP